MASIAHNVLKTVRRLGHGIGPPGPEGIDNYANLPASRHSQGTKAGPPMSQPLSVLKSYLGLAEMLDAGLTGRVLDLSLIMQGGSMAAFSPILVQYRCQSEPPVYRVLGAGTWCPCFIMCYAPISAQPSPLGQELCRSAMGNVESDMESSRKTSKTLTEPPCHSRAATPSFSISRSQRRVVDARSRSVPVLAGASSNPRCAGSRVSKTGARPAWGFRSTRPVLDARGSFQFFTAFGKTARMPVPWHC